MSNRIKELEKEVALTKELIDLRRKLKNLEDPKDAVAAGIRELTGYATGGFVPSGMGGFLIGSSATTAYSADTKYAELKGVKDGDVKWDPAKDMWRGIQVPSYNEGRGPCECE